VRALKWIGWLMLALAVLAVVLVLSFSHLRGPISRAVTKATGRELIIEGDLSIVPSWVHPRFRAEGVSFANAEWGSADYLLKAEAIEFSVNVLGLLRGRLVLPEVALHDAEVNLELDAEGRKNWVLDPKEQKKDSRIVIQRLTVDQGILGYEDETRDHSLLTELSTDEGGVGFRIEGVYSGLPMKAAGYGGPVLKLRKPNGGYPLKGEAQIGDTTFKLEGEITELIGLRGMDMQIQVSGKSMDQLYQLVHVAFPRTSPYTSSGRLKREGGVTRYEKFTGKVGESDLAGTLSVDNNGERPFMQGDLVSKVLNLADLGPLVGTNRPSKTGILPDAPFDPGRWSSVDADVRLKAGTIKRPEQLPLEDLAARIQMRDSVLTLNPLEFGIAGGKIAGPIRLDGSKETIRADTALRVQKLQLAKLFPTVKQNQTSLGDIGGLIELKGSGNSVAKMLASADGKIGLFIDDGKVSAFLMQLAAMDLWNVARVKLSGDKPIELRCAIADFGVKGGVMQTNAFVFDTAVVVINGEGTINLGTEEMDLKLGPKPKEKSLASLNSPLYIRGTFLQPEVSPDVGRMAAKGIGAIVMGALNPLLALVPLINEGPGKDSNCAKLIAEVAESNRQAHAKAKVKAPPSSGQSPASGATAKRPPSPPAR
jgi:AsmA family protein